MDINLHEKINNNNKTWYIVPKDTARPQSPHPTILKKAADITAVS